jgi:putative restriction endonuclease
MLRADSRLATELATEILSRHFPMTLYREILEAVGLDIQLEQTLRRRRDPNFRTRVLRAYEYRCAVCGYDIRLGNREVALEAAHIKWHQAGGPDVEPNGLALCALHHRLFDRGAFTLTPDCVISVSQVVHGTQGFSEWLLSFNGQSLRQPQCKEYLPHKVYVKWHGREVFRGPARGFPTTAVNA